MKVLTSDRSSLSPASKPAPRPPVSSPSLVHLTGEVGGRRRRYLLRPGTSSLGSRPANDLVVPVEGVSRRHLLLRIGAGGIEIEDLGSKNGTYVQGRRVSRSPVAPGERITVGPVELLVEEVRGADATIAIPARAEPGAVAAECRDEPVASTVHLAACSPAVLERWLASLDRALEPAGGDPGRSERSAALGAAVRELGADAGVLLAAERGETRVVAAAGAVAEGGLLDGLSAALGAPCDLPGGRFVLSGAPRPAAYWIGPGCRRGLGLAGDFAGRGQSEPLLRMLARSLDRPAAEVAETGPAAASSAAAARAGLRFPPGYVAGRSPSMRELYRRLSRVAASDEPVLLVGETGVGKEPLARIVHDASGRGDGPLVSVNCAAIPVDLLEAELFGVARGAATGVAARRGRFLEARGGTLVLDEIGELPLGLQAKLLRAIENREIPRLGGRIETSDARIVALTNRDLEAAIEAGTFRADLYYRIGTHEIRVPPLRRRRDDVPALVERFLARAAAQRGGRVAGVSAGALELLIAYPWPGNVRELENEIRRLVAACPDGGLIDSSMVSARVRDGARGADGGTDAGAAGRTLAERVAELETRAIESALAEAAGNRTRAAELLGLHRNSLAAKISRLGIDPRRLLDPPSES